MVTSCRFESDPRYIRYTYEPTFNYADEIIMLLKNSIAHYSLILAVFLLSLLFSLPNLYPDSPALQITAESNLNPSLLQKSLSSPDFVALNPHCTQQDDSQTVCLFSSVDDQMHAREFLQQKLPRSYQISLSLVESTPRWMQSLGLHPMKLGLDLRGGVHLLLNVETSSTNQGHDENTFKDLLSHFRSHAALYQRAQYHDGLLTLHFSQPDVQQKAQSLLAKNYPHMTYTAEGLSLQIRQSQESSAQREQYVINKTIESIEKRVNELGLSEAVVQKHGSSQISVDIPGIQDIEHAKSILGNTATLSFQLVNTHLESEASTGQLRSQESEVVKHSNGAPVVVFKKSVLSGDAITLSLIHI